jgi:WD40 repeat protein
MKRGKAVRTVKSEAASGLVAVTQDGRHGIGVTQSSDDEEWLYVWDVERDEAVHILRGPTGTFRAVAVTPDGRYAVSGSLDTTLKVWDLERGELLRTMEGHDAAVYAVVVTPDGHHAVSGSWDQTLRVWDLEQGESLRTVQGPTVAGGPDPLRVAVTPDVRYALLWAGSFWRNSGRAAYPSFDVEVWDLERGEFVRTLRGHRDVVNAVVVTPDGRHFLSGGADGALRLWDLIHGTLVATFSGADSISACAIGPDGLTFVAGDRAGRVHCLCLEGVGPEGEGLAHERKPPCFRERVLRLVKFRKPAKA